jgi:hypothetical protein
MIKNPSILEGFFRLRFLAFTGFVDLFACNQCFSALALSLVCQLAMAI